MKYRKILAMALSCVMAFSMTACGGTDSGSADKKEDTAANDEKTDDPGQDSSGEETGGETDQPSDSASTSITLWT